MFKSSYYNIYQKIGNNQVLLFNTMSTALIKVDNETAKNLRSENISKIPIEDQQVLESQGILIDSKLNEKQFYLELRKYHKFNESRTDIMLTITNACNASCEYCFESKSEVVRSLSPSNNDEIRNFITHELYKNKPRVFNLMFFGGEPLLMTGYIQTEIDYYKEYTNKNGIKLNVRIYTNGTLLPDSFLNYLKSNKVVIKDLQITLDGQKEMHDEQRPLKNGTSSFDCIIENLLKLKTDGIPYVIRINITKANMCGIEQLLNTLNNVGLSGSNIELYGVQSMSHSCADYKNTLTDLEYATIYPTLIKIIINKGFVTSILPLQSILYCSAHCHSSYVINYNLDVFKCALLQNDSHNKIGKIQSEKLVLSSEMNQLWNNIDPMKVKKCERCTLLPICGGGCSGVTYFKNGNFDCPNCYDTTVSMVKKKMILAWENIGVCNDKK